MLNKTHRTKDLLPSVLWLQFLKNILHNCVISYCVMSCDQNLTSKKYFTFDIALCGKLVNIIVEPRFIDHSRDG